MALDKITQAEVDAVNNYGRDDTPNLGTSGMQEALDAYPNLLVEKFNSLIDVLESTDEDEGGDFLGFNPGTTELAAANIGAAIREVATALASAVLAAGNVPAGGTTGQVLTKNSNTDHDLKWETIKDRLQFTDTEVATTAFVSDNTYTDFPYRASIALTGVTADMTPEVVLGVTEAMSGSYAPVSECYDGGVYIYASEAPEAAITIPTIICWKAVE